MKVCMHIRHPIVDRGGDYQRQSNQKDKPDTNIVLIIGVGSIGLASAQGLRLRSFPFRIFEWQAR